MSNPKGNPNPNWVPGVSGNPSGKRKDGGESTRNKLTRKFLEALCTEFEEWGISAIKEMRVANPANFIKAVSAIVPKELHIKDNTLEDMTEDELIDTLAAIRALTANSRRKGDREDVGAEGGKAPPRIVT